MGMVGVAAGCVGCHKLTALSTSCTGCHLRYCSACTAKFGRVCPNCRGRLV